MRSVTFEGLLPHAKKHAEPRRTDLQQTVTAFDKPALQSNLTARQAQSLRLLTFAGSKFQQSPGIRLESDFIQALTGNDPPEVRAGAAEILGEALSVNAVPALSRLLNDKEDVLVRAAAVRALGQIVASTHGDSYKRVQLGNTLLKYYAARKEAVSALFAPAKPFSLGERFKAQEDRDLMVDELSALVDSLSLLNFTKGREVLHQDFRRMLATNEAMGQAAQQMARSVQLAEEGMYDTLQRQYKRPIKEILANISPGELMEMRKKTTVVLADNSQMDMLAAMAQMGMMRGSQQYSMTILTNLMNALALANDEEADAALKLALNSSQPAVKAKGLELLSGRKGINYQNDILPNLTSTNADVRLAALDALLNSSDPAARQKTIDLLSPEAFMKVLGGQPGPQAIERFTGFLKRVAEDGDDYIDTLTRTAMNIDYDPQTRQIALMTIGFMAEPENAHRLQPATTRQAKALIRMIATQPPARTPVERETLALIGAQLWLRLKEPEAVENAIQFADSPVMRMNPKALESLLGEVIGVLNEDRAKNNIGAGEQRLQRRILEMLRREKSPLYTERLEQEMSAELGPNELDRIAEPLENASALPPVDADFAAQLEKSLPVLRPVLHRIADSDKTLLASMTAVRILGLLKDKESVDLLLDKTHDPLKGRVDWAAKRSYGGKLSSDGANMRVNALKALGDVGDSRALGAMLDALEDPVLRDHVVGFMAYVAKDANEKADDSLLQRTRDALSRMLADESVSRQTRGVRIKTANTLFKFREGAEAIKAFAATTKNPDFRRHALSALVTNNYALEPDHPDHPLVRPFLQPELGVERLHAKGLTGKGVELAVIDGGYVDPENAEAFQDRAILPASAKDPEHYHPSMVMSTAAANGKIRGVAPDAVIYSDKWPDFGDSENPMEVYKKIIAGKLRGENNVRAINNSWGLSNNNVIVFEDIHKMLREFKKVVELAERAGIQMVFAAGNDGENAGIPGLGTLSVFGLDIDKLSDEEQKDLNYVLDKVILVGATNTQGVEDRGQHRLTEFSSVGDSLNNHLAPTLVAPGADMMVYGWENRKHNPHPKELVNGTSFASPFVFGVIGLMTEANPNITPAQIREALKKTAVKLPHLPETKQGHGEIDPEAAVAMAKQFGKRRKKPGNTTKPAAG